jgi:hypothetical protein
MQTQTEPYDYTVTHVLLLPNSIISEVGKKFSMKKKEKFDTRVSQLSPADFNVTAQNFWYF